MQRTMLELGFLPAAYIPAMNFHRVERLDVIRMVKLYTPLELEGIALHETTQPMADLVIGMFQHREIIPRIAAAIPDTSLFDGFTEEQATRLASICTFERFQAGDLLSIRGVADGRAFLILLGTAEVAVDRSPQPVGTIEEGEIACELSLISDHPHTATITATSDIEAAVLDHEAITQLARQRPDIGLIIYRNLAAQLGKKLLRADRELAAMSPAENESA
jgi:hypothetical protein